MPNSEQAQKIAEQHVDPTGEGRNDEYNCIEVNHAIATLADKLKAVLDTKDEDLRDLESAFHAQIKRHGDTKTERDQLRLALADLLKAGKHEGVCDNEDDPEDSCKAHLEAYGARALVARALLASTE